MEKRGSKGIPRGSQEHNCAADQLAHSIREPDASRTSAFGSRVHLFVDPNAQVNKRRTGTGRRHN